MPFIPFIQYCLSRNALMNTVRLVDTHEEIIGLSGHLLAVSRRK